MILARTKSALKHAFNTCKKEGFIPCFKLLGRDISRFLRYYIFRYDHLCLYEHTIKERDEADFLPKIQNVAVRIVFSNQQADMMAADGLDFREHSYIARQALDKGAIAFCIFVGGEFAHIGFVALNEEAKNTFDSIPYRINFTDKEACTGGTFTLPKFRGKGLMKYGYFKRFQFLRENGIKISRNAVKANNIASRKVHDRFNPKIYAEARYVRFLWWKFLFKRKHELYN